MSLSGHTVSSSPASGGTGNGPSRAQESNSLILGAECGRFGRDSTGPNCAHLGGSNNHLELGHRLPNLFVEGLKMGTVKKGFRRSLTSRFWMWALLVEKTFFPFISFNCLGFLAKTLWPVGLGMLLYAVHMPVACCLYYCSFVLSF